MAAIVTNESTESNECAFQATRKFYLALLGSFTCFKSVINLNFFRERGAMTHANAACTLACI